MDFNQLTQAAIGAAIEVHGVHGPGLLESAYEKCLCYELEQAGIQFSRQVPSPVAYKGVRLDCGHRLDIVAEGQLNVPVLKNGIRRLFNRIE